MLMRNSKEKKAETITKDPKATPLSPWVLRSGIFLAAGFLSLLIISFHPKGGTGRADLVLGEPAPRNFYAPFALTYTDEKATEGLRQQERRAVPWVYAIDPEVGASMTEKLDGLFEEIQALRNLEGDVGPKVTTENLSVEISENALTNLLRDVPLDEIRKSLQVLLEFYMGQGLIDYRLKLKLLDTDVDNLLVMNPAGKSESLLPVIDLLTLEDVRKEAPRQLPENIAKNRRLKKIVLELFLTVLEENLRFDEAETQLRRDEVEEAVAPVIEEIKKNELILQRGRVVTSEDKVRWGQIQAKQVQKEFQRQILADGVLVLAIFGIAFFYLLCFEKKILLSVRMLLLFQSVIVLSLLVCKVILLTSEMSIYLMPTALAGLLLTLLISPRLGILGAFVMTGLAGPLSEYAPEVMLGALLATLAGTFMALKIRRRVQFLGIGAVIGALHFLILFAFQIAHSVPWQEAASTASLGFASGLLIVTPLCFFLLPLWETFFSVTTDVTLLELSDLNHPLLKRMIMEAPGTYHHSLVVSMLAESACQAIGANALLARVGCYFHDIGKIPQADFYTENKKLEQSDRHAELSPRESFEVILAHVTQGIELGKRYRLKEAILRFIPEHQGNGVVYYFYRKALDQAKPGEEIRADDFRYPGPKPQSRETAVALLADSTEAASRSLKSPTPENLRQLVRKIINDKFIDGQLDECDLTLKDLHRIQDSFVHNLLAIYHTRVNYPKSQKDPAEPDLFQKGQFQKFRASGL